jgi:ribosome recycling factor
MEISISGGGSHRFFGTIGVLLKGGKLVNPDQVIENVKQKLNQVTLHFEEELKKIRTGRAHPAMLDNVMVKAYGVFMPLKQLATISAPEGQLLQISPFDPTNISAINDAIREDQTLGLNPMDDGRIVRVPIPPLSTERRQEMVKQLGEKSEDTMIAARNARHEGLDEAKKAKIAKQIGEDDYIRIEKQIEDLMLKNKQQIDILTANKEKDIMTV